jgi:hypothetical protein
MREANKALHRLAIPLRTIAAGELRRETLYFIFSSNNTASRVYFTGRSLAPFFPLHKIIFMIKFFE